MNAELLDIELPDNMTLKVDRIGEERLYANNIVPGETVTFNYSGGSEYGHRTVLVVKVEDGALEGLTLERDGGYRRYLDCYVGGNYTIVEPFVVNPNPVVSGNVKRVRFDEAGTALLASLTGEQLAGLYGDYVNLLGGEVEFDPQTGEVVVQLPEPKNTTKVDIGSGSAVLTIANKNGRCLSIFLYGVSNSIGLVNEVTGTSDANFSVEKLSDELVKFLA